jgi:hypothetical protein
MLRCAWASLLLLLSLVSFLSAQSFSVFGVDVSAYPEISAKYLALDPSGKPLTNLFTDDFTITDNGVNAQVVLQSQCPPVEAAGPASVVLVNDRSGSMSEETESGASRLEIVKGGTRAFLTAFDFQRGSAVALTAFNSKPSILSDFRTSSAPLIAAIDTMSPDGGTDYNPAFLDALVGGIAMLAERPSNHRKILVFLTDGLPGTLTKTAEIINRAIALDIEIHVITIGLTIPATLRQIAEATGGTWYSNVNSSAEMEGIYRTIAIRNQGYAPCTLRWNVQPICGTESIFRTAEIQLVPYNKKAVVQYIAPDEKMAVLESQPAFLWFGGYPEGSGRILQCTITARRGAFTVQGATITSGQPFTITDWGGTAPPFTLQDGQQRTLSVRFDADRPGTYSSTLRLTTEPCPANDIFLAGGSDQPMAGDQIQLLSPVSGASYSGCDSILIQWAGVPPERTVWVEYFGSDKQWHFIDTATGGQLMWAPPGAGSYRIRVSANDFTSSPLFTVAGGGFGGDGGQATNALLLSPTGISISNNRLYIAESGGHRVRAVDLQTGIINTIAGTGNPGNSGDGLLATSARLAGPAAVLATSDRLYIADHDNHRIRMVDFATGGISTVAGIGVAGFSGDGGDARQAMIYGPLQFTFGTLGSNATPSLLFSDESYRVRAIDLTNGTISTEVGNRILLERGTARGAYLLAPIGIAMRQNHVFIAESANNLVRRADLAANQIHDLVGVSPDPGSKPISAWKLSSPTGVAVAGQNLFITDASNNRILRVNLVTGATRVVAGTGVAGYDGDVTIATSSKVNFPMSPVVQNNMLYFCDVRNGRVRAFQLPDDAGVDSNITAFTVARPSILLRPWTANHTVDFGRQAAGSGRDTLLPQTICNVGTVTAGIDSFAILGPDSASFAGVSGLTSIPLNPNECRTIELRFLPQRAGLLSATLVIFGPCGINDTLALRGEGLLPCGLAFTPLAQLGDVVLGAQAKDTVLSVPLCNTGAAPITGRLQLNPPNGAFRLLSNGGKFTLQPGECLNVQVRFAPLSSGRVTAELEYNIPTECGVASTTLLGRGLAPQQLAAVAAVGFPATVCTAAPHDTALALRNVGDIPLSITSADLLPTDQGFTVLNPPTATVPLVIAPGGSDTLRVRFSPATVGPKAAMLRVVSNAPDSPLNIPLTGQRDTIGAIAEQSSLTFAHPAASFPFDSFVVIRNTGTLPVSITDAGIVGNDADKFLLIPGQTPRTILPGDSARFAVRALSRSAGSIFQAELRLSFSPSCGPDTVQVALNTLGARPLLTATTPNLRQLVCDRDTLTEGTFEVKNEGSDPLTITEVRIEDDPDGEFRLLAAPPIVLAPLAVQTITAQFRPRSNGVKQAHAVLANNGADTAIKVRLVGIKETISFITSASSLDFGSLPSGAASQQTFTATNTGTFPIEWNVPRSVGPFSILSAEPPIAAPGQSSLLTVRFAPAADGIAAETIPVAEKLCDQSLPLSLSGRSGRQTTTTVMLPVASAYVGQQVLLPLTLRMDDPAAFHAIAPDSFATTIAFSNAILRCDSVIGANLLSQVRDKLTGEITLTIAGNYRNSDTLATILATALLGDRKLTPLTFQSFAWNKWNVAADTLNGTFAIVGDCWEAGLRFVAQPRLVKMAPQPARDQLMVELEVPEWSTVRFSVVASDGVIQQQGKPQVLAAGSHRLLFSVSTLPSGSYQLMMTTDYGWSAVPLVVVR